MRSDMAKVIVERPRMRRPARGQGSPYPRAKLERTFARDLEDAPSRLGMAAGHADKWLNENLAPLRRYLERQVGRPWSAVHSEISAHVRVTSAVQAHIKQHLEDFVVTSVVMIDGVPHGGPYGLQPLRGRRWGDGFYVCPRTGILRRTPEQPSSKQRRFGRTLRLDAIHELREVDGAWRHVTLARRPESVQPGRHFDVLLDGFLDATWFDHRARYQVLFGRSDAYAVAVRAPGRRELRRIEALARKARG